MDKLRHIISSAFARSLSFRNEINNRMVLQFFPYFVSIVFPVVEGMYSWASTADSAFNTPDGIIAGLGRATSARLAPALGNFYSVASEELLEAIRE